MERNVSYLENLVMKEEQSMEKLPEVTRLSEITYWIKEGKGKAWAAHQWHPQFSLPCKKKKTPIDTPSSLINLNLNFSKFYGQILFQDRKEEAFLF